MMHAELLGEIGNYVLTIEPITFRTLLARYSHALVIRKDGQKIDSHCLLYLSPSKQMGLSDSHGVVSWYRSGTCHVPGPSAIATQEMSFGDWLFRILSQVRAALTDSSCTLAFSVSS